MSSLSFPVIERHRRRRWFPTVPWSLLWLILVATLALLPWTVSNDLNPATVPTAVVLAVTWGWVLGWPSIHQRLPNLRLDWFGPALLQVVLIAMTGFFSLLLLIMRDHSVLRSTSPDGRLHAVLLAAPGDREHYVAEETQSGLMVRRVARINYALGKRAPSHFALVWKPDTQRLEVWGDGDLLEATAYDDGGLIPSRSMGGSESSEAPGAEGGDRGD